ncbi:MAG: pilus assembly protein TadG-related protein [Actinomycetota bacterium]
MKQWRNELGQVTVLVLGMGLLTFAVSGLAVDGTRAFLFRRTLQSSADAAALAGAAELDRDAYYRSGGRVRKIDEGAARAAALRWIELRGIGSRAAVSIEGDTVVVVLRDRVPTMFLALVGIGWVPVAADAAAQPRAGGPGG